FVGDLGRFLSVDSEGGDRYSPASFNAYSYVENKPLTSIDPDGRSSENPVITPSFYDIEYQLFLIEMSLPYVKYGPSILLGELDRRYNNMIHNVGSVWNQAHKAGHKCKTDSECVD